jgi:N-acetylglucosamine kinase-like BadF-type ATPase
MIFITADGGGTKIIAFAFDENLNVLASAKAGGVNSLFMDKNEARNNMANVADTLFDSLEKNFGNICEVEGLYYTIAGLGSGLPDEIQRHAKVKKTERLSEGQLGFLAGTLEKTGLLALSGTGSDCFLIENCRSVDMIGGWGLYFGDEGSGFDIGRKAIMAAIRSQDGRGEKTELEELVFHSLGLNKSLWEVCSIHNRPSFRKDVSSLTRAVETACGHGDRTALEIVQNAAKELSLATVTIMKKHGYGRNDAFVFTTAGGGWKTSAKMTETFVGDVTEHFPLSVFKKPLFEPVAGGVIKYIFDKGDMPREELLKEKLSEFLL